MEKAGLKVVDERGVVYRVMADSWALSDDMDVNYMLSATARGCELKKSYPPCLCAVRLWMFDRSQEPAMIVELVTFTFPKGHDRASELEAVRGVVREMGGEPGTGAQAFPVGRSARTKAPAPASISGRRSRRPKRAHNDEWREGVKKRTGGYPTIRYFDMMALVDNERGKVTEWSARTAKQRELETV